MRSDIEGLSETDLKGLIEGGSSEGLLLEFKSALYGASDADKRELLKDVSAFANSHGGHLVIGISEKGGVALEVPGVEAKDIDAEITRLDQIIRTGIEPRIPNFRIRAIKLSGGKHCIVMHIPRSWRVPHRICAQNTNRFWVRNSSGCHEASMDELRTLFGQTVSVIERARQFRSERLAQISIGERPRPLAASGRLIVHLVPYAAFLSSDSIDTEEIFKLHEDFLPIGGAGGVPKFNFEGVLIERPGGSNHGYTQIFRNGIIEATKAGLVKDHREKRCIPGLGLEQYFFDRLAPYVHGLERLGINAPLIVMITLDGVSGAHYVVSDDDWIDCLAPIDRKQLVLPDCVISEYGPLVSYHDAVRPAFDALWNAAGYPKSQFFNDEGLWTGTRQ